MKVIKNEAEATGTEKYKWKKNYSLVLIANAIYIILFYFIMKAF